MGEVWGRHGGGMGEVWVRYRGDRTVASCGVGPAAALAGRRRRRRLA